LQVERNRYVNVLYDSLAENKPTHGDILGHDGTCQTDFLNGPGVIPTRQILNNGWQLQGPGSEGEHLVEVAHALQLMIYLFETFCQPRDVSPIQQELLL
jgi:hypothetical protein